MKNPYTFIENHVVFEMMPMQLKVDLWKMQLLKEYFS